jgi:ABC-type Fe3+-hydroxamate transport system substrate-binding protein
VISRRTWCLVAFALLGCGRARVDAPTGPRARVISQVVLADEVLWELGPEVHPRVVAVSTMADDPRYSAVAGKWPASVARVAGGSEDLVALAPDLVVVADFTSTETRVLLERLGMPVLQLSGFDGFADYRRHVHALADALDVPAEGETLVAAFDARLAAMRARAQPGADAPAIVSWQEGTVAGTGTIFADQAEAAGFRLLPAEHGIVGHQSLALEMLIAWDPAYVVVACTGRDAEGCAKAEREFASMPGIAATEAAREGGVIAVPTDMLYSTGVGMLDVVDWLAARKRAP